METESKHDDPELIRAAAVLEGLIDLERRPRTGRLSLAPIRALLARLGSPERGLRVLHVAGSKGKGSTALMAEAVLRAAGLRVATFTSPHLERWTERFRVDGREIEPARLAAAVDQLEPHVSALRAAGGDQVPSFFDATTAAALLLFREARVDCAVLEVGLGGRLDSTNAVQPEVCVITAIELEHTDRLGTSLPAIAAEKAGILKAGVPALCGQLAPDPLAVVEARAAELGCPLARLGRELLVESEPWADGLGWEIGVRDGDFAVDAGLPVAGRHQPGNAALAVAAARRMIGDTRPVAGFAEAVRKGLAQVELPGRLEPVSPRILVDSAHTVASAGSLAQVLRELGRPVDFVLSVSEDKPLDAILSPLLPLARSLTLTRAQPSRSLRPEQIASAVRRLAPGLAHRVVPNPHLALRAAREALEPDAVLCVTGSFYLAGIARRVLREAPAPPVAVSRRGS